MHRRHNPLGRGVRPSGCAQNRVESLREAGRLATELGTRLALETSRNFEFNFSFVRTIPETMDVLDEVSEPGIGFCYDFYHLWDQENLLEYTERAGARTFGVQHNDWRMPRSSADRLLSGEGAMDIPAMLHALERGGFNG
ncbi:sugar phosphate isomerase/epimerase family protein [Sphingobium sp. HWE2-09]|uniref:sugar phosphate isomerase/epimerase family protein n=1 Tax=Sphingobium sp. HWE2-09 TaxID=3108390 RepID=UPI002DC0CA23|nr:TIM barrel protein [Sphingobium sp. HWE2-09]